MSAIDMESAESIQPAGGDPAPIGLKKGYTLNEVEALRKKMKKADLMPAIEITDEARNRSSINIDMKKSLFEFMKEAWIGDMKNLTEIINVTPLTKAVAETLENGNASKYEAITVKIKCYPTKCRMQIQHMGWPSKPKEKDENQ